MTKPDMTCPVLGIPLAVTDYAGAVARTQAWARVGTGVYAVAAANTHVVALARHDPAFRKVLDQFDLLLPDGMPLVWCMNKTGAGLKDRVYGPTFMLRCLEDAEGRCTHFLLGGSDELLSTLQKKLQTRFPKIRIAGTYSPPFGTWPEDETTRIIERIRDSRAGYVWVSLGCPKQERWIAQHKAHLPPGVYCGVGAAFAFHTGRVKQAPVWMQNAGLEWAFRLFTEPRRLWKRYVVYNSLFVFYFVYDKVFRASR